VRAGDARSVRQFMVGEQRERAVAVVEGAEAVTIDNGIGVSGVAPRAGLANWIIFDRFGTPADEEQLADMFHYASNVVSVQNHSWGNVSSSPLAISSIESAAISNAVTLGRGGRGVVIVRSAGNGRDESLNANDDGYASDPRAIAVAAVRYDGRVARYSNPGACVLVAAPSGDDEAQDEACLNNSPTLFTTDRQGEGGYNRSSTSDDLSNYAFGSTGFSGTSGAAPQISGVVALILAANPHLTYRDVQQVLAHSARHSVLFARPKHAT
jgi:subtilisin family serine protease